MQTQFYEQTCRAEDRHWWFQSRLELVAEYLEKMALPADARILDVGCGTGGTTRFLERYGHVTGIDKSPIAVGHARAKASLSTVIEGDVNELDRWLQPESFDLVTFFCVLYHCWIPDDVKVLRQVQRVLKRGGRVLLTEPAFKVLAKRHDVVAQGKTRYRLADFRRYFPQAGLTFEGGRYFNAAAFPVCLAAAVGHRLLGRADDGNGEVADLAFPPRIINRALMFYLAMERRFSRWVPLPVGVTLLAMGRKPVAAPGRADEVTDAPARHQDNVLADGWTEPRPQHEPGAASPAIHCHSDS